MGLGFHMPPPPIPPLNVVFTTPDVLWYMQPDLWTGIFTLLLAVATFWLGWETRGLRKDSLRAIAAAERTVGAAIRGVDASEESMRRTLRAYVTVGSVEALGQDIRQVPRSVRISVANTGQTPASGQEVFYTLKVVGALPLRFDNNIEHYSTMMCSVLGRDQERSVVAECNLTDGECEDILRGSVFLMAYGCVRYFDMFEKTTPRHTEFSYAWDCAAESFYPVGPMNAVT
jgi:hypothetical protein